MFCEIKWYLVVICLGPVTWRRTEDATDTTASGPPRFGFDDDDDEEEEEPKPKGDI